MCDNLFRVWDKKRKKMIYNSMDIEIEPKDSGRLVYSDIGDIAMGMDGTLYLIDECGSYEYAGNLGEDYEVMFYIGLKDKNRKAIYAGDIVVWERGIITNYKKMGIVRWNDEIAGFRVYYKTEGREFSRTLDEDCEVIGNIYENENLLG